MTAWPAGRARTATGIALICVLLAATTGYVLWRARAADSDGAWSLRPDRPGTVVYVDRGRVRQVPRGAGERAGRSAGKGPDCQRAAVAGGTLVCLRGLPGPMSSDVRVYRGPGKPQVTLPVWGEPSRARVSPSGHLVAWTVFRSGDSYVAQGQFSTTAGIYDLRDGDHYGSLEDFRPYVGGKPYRAEDVNYWGITFAADDRTFYATMASKGRTWLMRGDLTRRTLTALRENVECPSLSPDGHRIAYKKRTGDRWRLHVLTLRGGRDVPLAETASIDDQPAWLDDDTIAYTRPGDSGPTVFTTPADGTGTPSKLLNGASATAPVPRP
ncbi:hypothetical protein G5C51_19205 [Streptomyces sp. A7024]|uniref:TolB n=1 Tax=Streptomyces coryli TaxID=1128680 RepID=A0A6G4U1Y6_9ACTN|nr:PD40 domain-containing protein [Streptomyces coryli]NGN66012.1 hypothetical protein [Streptomyces coryli]